MRIDILDLSRGSLDYYMCGTPFNEEKQTKIILVSLESQEIYIIIL